MQKVSPYKTKLDAANAYWMARISSEVYLRKSDKDPSPDEIKILKNLQQDDEKFISVYGVDKNSAQGIIVEHEDYLCLAFRGTDELADWLDNINAFAVDRLFGEFHQGFWKSLDDIWSPLYQQIIDLQVLSKRPIFITGHSLGGAMATIAAAKLIHEDKPFTNVYTFGQPRAMTRATSRLFNAECKSRFFRFHNNNDLVTRVPARFMGYSHIGSYLYISQEGIINQDSGFWFRFLDYVDGAFNAVQEKGLDGIEDHAMGNYLKFIIDWQLDE